MLCSGVLKYNSIVFFFPDGCLMLHVPGTSEVIDFIGPKIKSDVSICPMLPIYLCVLRAVT